MINAQDDTLTQSNEARPSGRASAVKNQKNKRSRIKTKKALKVKRVFSSDQESPYDQIEWDKRVAEITDGKGKVIFRQEGVEVPGFSHFLEAVALRGHGDQYLVLRARRSRSYQRSDQEA